MIDILKQQKDNITAAIRTGAAVVAGAILTFLVNKLGVELPDSISTGLNVLIFAVTVGAYNYLVNFLSSHVSPMFGYLLILPKTPTY